jgi:hypothetical protein
MTNCPLVMIEKSSNNRRKVGGVIMKNINRRMLVLFPAMFLFIAGTIVVCNTGTEALASSHKIKSPYVFRVTFSKAGIIDTVEIKKDEQWTPVDPKDKGAIIKGTLFKIMDVHILMGDLDPCIEQMGESYCW